MLEINVQGQPVQLLDKSQLAIFHQRTTQLDTWVLDTFFPKKQGLPLVDTDSNKSVYIGSLRTSSQIAPLVAPSVQGRVMVEKAQYNAKNIPAPYLKPAATITPENVTDIALLYSLQNAGIISNVSNMTGAEKLRVAQIRKYNMLHESITNFKVKQAFDILTVGKTTFASDDFPEVLVDYGRDPDLVDYHPMLLWSDPNATPITDLNGMIAVMNDKEGVSPTIVLTRSAVINKLKTNKQFRDEFITPNGANAPSPISPAFITPDKPQYHGSVGNIQFWSYDKVYFDVDGTRKNYIADGMLYLIADTQGYQVSCGLINHDVLNQPLEFYDYMVKQDDPNVIKMITEASPLIVPSMVNGVISAKVL